MDTRLSSVGHAEAPRLAKYLEMLRTREGDLRARGVLHVAIFGSVARGDDDTESDIDVIVETDHLRFQGFGPLFDLEDELATEFGRRVDVVAMDGLKSPKHDHIIKEMVFAF